MKLGELADVVRSKNAGIHYVTIDVLFEDRDTFERVAATEALTAESAAAVYDLPPEAVRFFEYDPGLAFKVTIPRDRPAGSPGDPDLYGAQQHAPLLDLDIPVEAGDVESAGGA